MAIQPAKGGNLNSGRINDIASKIHGACIAISDDHRSMVEHQEAVQGLSTNLQNQRLSIAREIAEMSIADKWSKDDINAAAKRAAAMGNKPADERDRTEKTVATFISEVKLFALPKVREHTATIIDAATEAWSIEDELRSQTDSEDRADLDLPVHKFSARLYHLITHLARQVNDGKLTIADAGDVERYCRMNDPDFDQDKVAKRLEGVVKALNKIVTDFGNNDVAEAMNFLKDITPEELLQSRTSMLDNAKAKIQAETATTVVTPETKPEPEAAPSVAQGVVDIDNLLNDGDDNSVALKAA